MSVPSNQRLQNEGKGCVHVCVCVFCLLSWVFINFKLAFFQLYVSVKRFSFLLVPSWDLLSPFPCSGCMQSFFCTMAILMPCLFSTYLGCILHNVWMLLSYAESFSATTWILPLIWNIVLWLTIIFLNFKKRLSSCVIYCRIHIYCARNKYDPLAFYLPSSKYFSLLNYITVAE